MSTSANRVQTRAKNANTHPGNVLKSTSVRRTPQQIAADKIAADAAKKKEEGKRNASILRLARLEGLAPVAGAESHNPLPTPRASKKANGSRTTVNQKKAKRDDVASVVLTSQVVSTPKASVTATAGTRSAAGTSDPFLQVDDDAAAAPPKGSGKRKSTGSSSSSTAKKARSTPVAPLKASPLSIPGLPPLDEATLFAILKALPQARATTAAAHGTTLNAGNDGPALPQAGTINESAGFVDDDEDSEASFEDNQDINMDDEDISDGAMMIITSVGITMDKEQEPPEPPMVDDVGVPNGGRRSYTLAQILHSTRDQKVWRQTYCPKLIAAVGRWDDSWDITFDRDFPELVTDLWHTCFAYTDRQPQAEPGQPLYELSKQVLSTWRHNLSKAAESTPDDFVKESGRYDLQPNATPEEQAEMIKTQREFLQEAIDAAIAPPHRPFRFAEMTKKQDGRLLHKAYRGRFQSYWILKTFAHHLQATRHHPDSSEFCAGNDKIGWPVGALALSAAAVERVLSGYCNGVFSPPDGRAGHFSFENWGTSSAIFARAADTLHDTFDWPVIIEKAMALNRDSNTVVIVDEEDGFEAAEQEEFDAFLHGDYDMDA
ncbi:hypothetical protein BXZ70DRAFT_1013323 [Cristinia sonorae]|uniref:Uncharacterized protein n=1 Tax=Cristinia sonorae TaxID=1940300 RepID=A0A8K0UD83_9AGAR|nr:hypothetical protein BXZ70DRAFT_1013323 [Cristinia sonorae]